MAQFRVLITGLGNAAFEDGRDEEIARILTTVADQLRDGVSAGSLRDIKGNTVGDFGIKLDDDEVMP